MLVNSSSISKDFEGFQCYLQKISLFISTGIMGTKILFLIPLSSYIIYLGHQRWQQQQRSFKTCSHSDLFSYHLAVMEIVGIPGYILMLGGIYTDNSKIIIAGMCSSYVLFYGELFFNLLTCLERYLAVVHPITYRGLKNTRGIRNRNITIGCIWLLCFGMTIITNAIPLKHEAVIKYCIVVFSILVILFSSISVLCVLFRLGPREGGGKKKDRFDQSRMRAFYTIMVISSVVWLWFVVVLIDVALTHVTLSVEVKCLIEVGIGWLNLPCSLVSPLIYLHKERKLF